MSDQFQRTIGDLWATLSLPEPVFGESASIILTIDTTSITLEESQDSRHIDLWSAAGRLSRDPVVRTMQIHDILTANLGTLTSLRASVSIAETERPDAEVIVRSVYAYEGNRAGRLLTALEDVVSLSQAHGIRLHGASAGNGGQRAPEPARPVHEDYSIIFRP